MTYEFVAMPSETAAWHRQNKLDRDGNEILQFHDGETYPCRHCLREAGRETGALLFSYQPPRPVGVYAQSTAVFICKAGCKRYPGGRSVPDIVRNRFVALRAFRADGLMAYSMNTLTEGAQAETEIEKILVNDDIAHINIHTALAGCMLCTVRRT